MDWLTALIEKSSSADLVLLAGIGSIVWLVASKHKIQRGTVELALKHITWIVFGTLGIRALLVIKDIVQSWQGG